MMKIMFVVVGCCLATFGVGQDVEFGAVSKLPATINTACEEILPVASPDGKTLYFARVACDYNTSGKAGGSDIWYTEYEPRTKEWSRPKNSINVFNDRDNNAIVGMSTDGQTLYQVNTAPGKKIKGVYFSKKENSKWTQPQLESIPFLETQEYFGLYVSPDFKTIIASMKRDDGRGEEDLYVSHKDGQGKWSEPKSLGEKINSIGFEISPFLSKDTKRLYFASNGHRGLGGSDIFYADRLDDSWTSWSAPVNLGNVINTEGFDAYFSMNDSVAWFSSRNGISTDIYKVKIVQPEDRRKAVVSNIVQEANSMLADLNDDTYDSLSSFTQSVFVSFERNTAILSADAIAHLDEAVGLIRKKRQGKLSLIAYTNSGGAESGQLWDKRLEEIRKYLRQKSGLDLMIDHEIWRVDISESAGRGSVVEVRYN
ncbi:MAG TPA: hypothetical protein VFE50_04370 [Cyclobacteriaceae bacterium]|nr:hypothetical protein [Cyclobacteriaceae bacterium]